MSSRCVNTVNQGPRLYGRRLYGGGLYGGGLYGATLPYYDYTAEFFSKLRLYGGKNPPVLGFQEVVRAVEFACRPVVGLPGRSAN